MKKILFAAMALVSLAVSSYGQGEVLFSAGSLAATRIYTNTVVGGQSTGQVGGAINAAQGSYYFALFYASSSVTTVAGNTPWLDANWTAVPNTSGTNTGVLGRMAGLTVGNADSAAVIPGFAAGTTASLIAIGWNSAVGGTTLASFENAYAQGLAGLYYGYSAVGGPQLGNGATTPNVNLFGAGAGQIGGFTLAPVPEPTAFALTGIGAAAMLIFRRRK